MMPVRVLAVILAGCLLSGCGDEVAMEGGSSKSQGRYSGIGTFEPGRLWAEMAGVEDPTDPAAARLEDDEHIIVVIDTHTGEVRQCGNNSGVCVTMNPWSGPGSPGAAPVKLDKHAAELDAEEQAAADRAAAAADGAEPAE